MVGCWQVIGEICFVVCSIENCVLIRLCGCLYGSMGLSECFSDVWFGVEGLVFGVLYSEVSVVQGIYDVGYGVFFQFSCVGEVVDVFGVVIQC